MVIRMSQNTQVVRAALATVRREITRIFALSGPKRPTEHWQVAQPETSEQRTRRRSKNAAWALGSALLFVGCNVYDSSLLDTSALASRAGSDGGGQLANAGNSADGAAGNGNASATGGAGSAAGSNGLAGMDSAGDSSGGSSGSVAGAGTVGVGGSGTVAGSNGGGAPAGGAGAGAGGAVNAMYSLIDDMETVDANIPSTDGRQGFWSVANDGTPGGKQTPSPTVTMSLIPGGGRGTSLNAFHTTAMGYTTSGALIGVDLNRKGATRNTYDASPYNAVHFWMRVETGSPTAVHFAILDKHTDPGGAWCCISATNCAVGATLATGGLCYDHFGKDLPAATTQWTERTVTFAELDQVGWGDNKVTDLDTAHIYAIQFNWLSAAMDLWIDDISFVKK
jgi:hypothetical protein